MRTARLFTVLCCLLLSGCAFFGNGDKRNGTQPSPGVVPLDLAGPVDSTVVSLSSGSFQFLVQNLAPAQRYTISAGVANRPVAMVDLVQDVQPSPPPPLAPTDTTQKGRDACRDLEQALLRLAETEVEDDVPLRVSSIEAVLRACSDPALRSYARDRIAATTWRTDGTVQVAEGQVFVLRVERSDPSRRWARVYETGARGEWRRTYGFTFINDHLNPDNRYFVEEDGQAGRYVIRGRRAADRFAFTPTLFYTWMPARDERRDLSFSPSVGLGFDFSAPVVTLGGTATYNQNLAVSAGAAFHQVQRLSERYTVGQTVPTILGEAELQRSVYRPNFYLAVSIRSLTNPFQRADETQR